MSDNSHNNNSNSPISFRPADLVIPNIETGVLESPDAVRNSLRLESQQKFYLSQFFREKILCTQPNSIRYADMLFKNGVTDLEILDRKLQRSPDFLLNLGVEEHDAQEVADYFLMTQNTSQNQRKSQNRALPHINSGFSAVSTPTDSFYSHAGGSSQKEASIVSQEIAKLYYDASQSNLFEALQQLKELAVDGSGLAQGFLMRMYAIGQGSVVKDLNKAHAMADQVYPYLTELVTRRDTDRITLMYARYLMGLCISEGLGTKQDHKEALPWYRLSAEHGYAAAQAYLGTCYYDGIGIEADYNEAVRWYKLAAEQGFASAQCNLGLCYEQGHGIPQNFIEAVKWYRLGANQGHGASRYNLAYCYEKGIGVEKNLVEAINLYIESAEKGYSPAQYILGTFYAIGKYHLPQNDEKAFRWYARSADSGHTVGMYKTALAYEQGIGTEANIEEALVWYRKSGREGHMPSRIKVALISSALGVETNSPKRKEIHSANSSANSEQFEEMLKQFDHSDKNVCPSPKIALSSNVSEITPTSFSLPSGYEDGGFGSDEEFDAMDPSRAIYELGLCYEQGKGVEPDYEAAMQWYTVSATDGGNADSQFRLGLYHEMGTNGVEKDIFQALQWYRQAAQSGHPIAQYKIGICYEKGMANVETNENFAVTFYRQSAEQGYAPAQHQLGLCYFNGIGGLKPSMKEAVHWYQLAAEQGYPPAINSLGFCYFHGHHLNKNMKLAIKLYKLAADAGYVVALNNLGHCYLQGSGVYKNEVLAFRLFKISAKLGYAPSQNNVGNCYFDGIGVAKSLELAFGWYKLAAEQEYATAQYNIGYCYEKGFGTRINLIQAVRYYHLAAVKGNRKAMIAIRKFPNASSKKKSTKSSSKSTTASSSLKSSGLFKK